MSGIAALADLFRDLFSNNELYVWLKSGTEGRQVTDALPGVNVSGSSYAFAAAEVLQRRGLIDTALFERLEHDFPSQADRVREVWGGAAGGSKRVRPPPPAAQSPSVPARGAAPETALGSAPWWRLPTESGVQRLTITIGTDRAWHEPSSLADTTFTCTYALQPGGRPVPGRFTSPWNDQELTEIRAYLSSLNDPPGADKIKTWGLALRRAFEGLDLFVSTLLQSGSGPVEVEIRTLHQGVIGLPWELMTTYDGPNARPIALMKDRVLLRSVFNLEGTRARQADDQGGALLFAWSDAGDPVPHAEHEEALRALLKEELIVVPKASLRSIREAAAASTKPVRAMHLLCHGRPTNAKAWGLSLYGPKGAPVAVEAQQISSLLLENLRDVELLTLAACNGANPGEPYNPLGTVAEAAWSCDVNVIASQLPLPVDAASTLVEVLYPGLIRDRRSLTRAYQQTVSLLHMDYRALDWAKLVLMTRSTP